MPTGSDVQATKVIAFVCYETRYAPCGGIKAVMDQLPKFIKAAAQQEVIVITPYHGKIEETGDAAPGMTPVPMAGREAFDIRCLTDKDGIRYFFIHAHNLLVFAGEKHPYDMPAAQLASDASFFGEAVARSLPDIGRHLHAGQDRYIEWILMPQDWEAATLASAMWTSPLAWNAWLTLHNSYDQPLPHGSVLTEALAFVQPEVFSVSDQFADDLTNDVLQSEVMAPHLTELLKPRLRGVNNGPFASLSVDPEAFASALAGDHTSLAEWKDRRRSDSLKALESVTPPGPGDEIWVDLEKFDRNPQACWFVMGGRDDSRQKGYDVTAEAVRAFLGKGLDARFFFFPMAGDEVLDGLRFLEALVEDYPEKVVVLPFRWAAGFKSTIQGASWGLMPSLYEPFGGANEFYLWGTPGVARATGGLIQQVVPLRSAACFSRAVATRVARWHHCSAQPTGLLFRESDQLSSRDNWDLMNSAVYDRDGRSEDNRIAVRRGNALFRGMVRELSIALEDAQHIWHADKPRYFRMMVNGVLHIQQNFSWERTAQEYLRYVL